MENSLVVKLNRVIANHYPEGRVDYGEATRALVALSVAHQKMLRKLNAAEADRVSAEAVAARIVADAQESAESQARQRRAGRVHASDPLPYPGKSDHAGPKYSDKG